MKRTILGFYLFLIVIINSNCKAQLRNVFYKDGEVKLNGLLSVPKKVLSKKSGILILPAWMGIDANSKSSAEQLTQLGYYTFIADIYGEGNYPTDMQGAAKQSSYFKKNINQYRNRIKLALEELIKAGADPNNIVVIGYCFGGTGALEAARANFNVKGVVSFHGGLGRDTTKSIETIIPKVLVCHGADDFFVPEQEVKSFQSEMKKAKADWQMNYYSNAVHAFTDKTAGNDNSKGAAYNETAARRSWESLLQFLKEVL